MRLSYVIISFNRRETLLKTLALLPAVTPLGGDQWEIWVVDNASGDGSAEAVERGFPHVHLIRNKRNEGMSARNRAFEQCAGEYVVSLDDDSYPADPIAVPRMMRHLDENPQTAAVVARVHLPDGEPEAAAFPTVLLGGATCFRRRALDELGGFAPDFFRQAEEYDLSFRIWSAGYVIERFEDVIFRHDKVAGAGRASALIHRMDVRNNLIVAARFLPPDLRGIYRGDWAQRYSAIARHAGHAAAALQGRCEAGIRVLRESWRGRRLLAPEAIERIFELDTQTKAVSAWAKANRMRRIVIADFAKNIYATYRACCATGLIVTALADSNPAFAGMRYRGVPILPGSQAFADELDGVVLANINPAQVDGRLELIRREFAGPVLRLWHPRYLSASEAVRASAA